MSRNEDKLIHLDIDRLHTELRKIVKEATEEAKRVLLSETMKSARLLPMKDNIVTMADGTTTSDSIRQDALIQSIKAERAHVDNWGDFYGGYLNHYSTLFYETSVTAMGDNFKDSHIGWYYEVGTGEESNPKLYAQYGLDASLGDVNPYRLPHVGAPIVSRSKRDGDWVDLGGNLRKAISPIGGIGGEEIPKNKSGEPFTTPEKYEEIKKRFRASIGDDIQAYEWFRKSLDSVSDQIFSIYVKALKGFNIFDPKYKIFFLKKEYFIGRRGK